MDDYYIYYIPYTFICYHYYLQKGITLMDISKYIQNNLSKQAASTQPAQDTEEAAYRSTAISYQVPSLLKKLTAPQNVYYETGFSKLDKLLSGGLEPGALVVLGGLAGIGKTTLALQMAYNVSKRYRKDVLFLALEMTEFQMQVKLLSMLTADIALHKVNNQATPLSVQQIRNTESWGMLTQDEADLYLSAASEMQDNPNLFILSPGKATADTVKKAVERHKAATGEAPIVFVDYLQYIKPDKPTVTDKQAIDGAVEVLKEIAIEHDTPVLALSSLSRNAYQAPSIGAAKGSGEIEYTASTVLMLTLPTGVTEGDAQSIDSKRSSLPGRFIPSTKRLQLTAVKNRSAANNCFMLLDFMDEYNYFIQAEQRLKK